MGDKQILWAKRQVAELAPACALVGCAPLCLFSSSYISPWFQLFLEFQFVIFRELCYLCAFWLCSKDIESPFTKSLFCQQVISLKHLSKHEKVLKQFFKENCPILNTSDLLGKNFRWTLLVVEKIWTSSVFPGLFALIFTKIWLPCRTYLLKVGLWISWIIELGGSGHEIRITSALSPNNII